MPARVGLLGNPSDGYGGKTLALAIAHMTATVSVEEDTVVRISGPRPDPFEFDSLGEFADFVDRYGYGSGEQLLAATLRTFVDLARSQSWSIPSGVDIGFNTTIPRGVGMAGSSALVIALLRCLLHLTGHELDRHLLPSLALSAETDQLHLNAGLQDRVVQTYGGLVAMDFGQLTTDPRTGLSYGSYEALDSTNLPRLFVAYSPAAAEPSSTYHSTLRGRYNADDSTTHAGLSELAGLVSRGKAALRWGGAGLGPLLAQNMAIRSSLAPVPPSQLALIEAARSCDLDATFTGSGGAIVGAFTEDSELQRLEKCLYDPEAVVREIQTFSYSG